MRGPLFVWTRARSSRPFQRNDLGALDERAFAVHVSLPIKTVSIDLESARHLVAKLLEGRRLPDDRVVDNKGVL